ncbi:hypothetical protein OTB20_17545 [Streptomyces sp. H27-H1]|uniref:hypothetical protein n=1 Tax=Streptomyces sp. H27-H1 TaxID=2996461 RepID=UPI0022718596|nr:hypothetical protein [Streptomyces sp. H27-H1]MCY0927972.1 hypothetical protein [Streptomyces sp. H27-H1]
MITVDVQHCGSTVPVNAGGEVDEDTGEAFQTTLNSATTHHRARAAPSVRWDAAESRKRA